MQELSEEVEIVLQPWQLNSYRLTDWWEMQQFSARMFYLMGWWLEGLRTECLMTGGQIGEAAWPSELLMQKITDDTARKALKMLERADTECDLVGMPISGDTIRELKGRLQGKQGIITYQQLMDGLNNLEKLISKEMVGKIFLYIPPEKARFLPKKDQYQFGQQVANAFPSAGYDVFEAGFCLAVARSTACVFHLMRILEIGLRTLGGIFSVSLERTNWAPAIEEIESKIRKMHADPAWKVLPDCKEQQEFYAQAASHFGVLKDAWRNYTMHSRGKYTEEEAEHLFSNTKRFMCKLSERLSE